MDYDYRAEECTGQMTDTAFILCLVNIGFSLICDLVILHTVSEIVKSCMRSRKMEVVLQEVMKHENEEAKKDD